MNEEVFQIAFSEAQKAFDEEEIPVGAVLFETKTGKIIAAAHNLTEQNKDVSAHAEILALKRAGEKLQTTHFQGYSLFSTLEPCPMCAGALAWAQIDRVYFSAYDSKSGGTEHGARIFEHTAHCPEIYGGIREKEGAALMKKFFKEKR